MSFICLRSCQASADRLYRAIQSFPFFLGSGASFFCVDTWRSVSVDTILRHLRILTLNGRKVDASLPPSMLEDIADSRDIEGVVSTSTMYSLDHSAVLMTSS